DFELSDRLKRAGCRVRFERRMILRFFYPPALRNLRQSFLRAGKWMILRWGGFSFDRHTTTRRQAAGVVLGALGFPVLLAAVLGGLAWQWVMGWLSVYLGVLWPFLRFCRRQKSSFYQPIAVVLHMLLALVVISGVARAVLWRVTRAGPLEEFITTHDN
ncbi:hypothetical protein EBX31_12070, partial [bacterium]|nr:hypothetical protein [bacterium]